MGSATERAVVLFTLTGVLTLGSLALIVLAPKPLSPARTALTAEQEATQARSTESAAGPADAR